MIFPSPVDFTNMATICMMSPKFPGISATAHFRESDTDHLEIECLQIEVVRSLTGELVDVPYDPTGVDGFMIVFGPAPAFTQIITGA